MLLKDTSFAGGFQLIVLGVPIVGVLEYYSRHPKSTWVAKDFNEIDNGEDCAHWLRYFSQIAYNKHEIDNRILKFCVFLKDIELMGFMTRHISVCKIPNCQLDQYWRKHGLNDNSKFSKNNIGKFSRFQKMNSREVAAGDLCKKTV